MNDPAPNDDLAPARVEALFTRSDGAYRFARWGRPLAPAVFGLGGEDRRVFVEALGAVAGLGGLALAEEDPELGANCLVLACDAWAELRGVPGLDRLIPDLARLVTVLEASGANQYRIFGFEDDGAGRPGAIRICVTLLRLDEDLARFPVRVLAAGQAVQALLLWSDHAFTAESPVAEIAGTGRALVKPWAQALVRAAYDAGLPDAADEPAHAARLAALARGAGG
jgi:hypothetical protein